MRREAGAVQDVRTGVVERLRARQVELLEAIFLKVQAGTLAVSDELDAEYLAGLRAAVAAAVEYSLEGIEHGEEWAGPIPSAAVEQARRAACIGVSLEVVLRRYVVGSALLGEFVLEETERGERGGRGFDRRRVLRGALRAQASVLDRLLAAVTCEYRDALEHAQRSPQRRRCEILRNLLEGGEPARRSELDYQFDGWHLALIAGGPDAVQIVQDLATDMDRRLLKMTHGEERLGAWLGGREPFAHGELERLRAGANANEGVVFAFGEPARDIEGWRVTHRQAQAALLVALRRPSPRGVTRYADVALLAFALRDETLARSLVEIYLTPLNDQRDGGVLLRETLRAYFAAGRSASSAAAALGVARQTVESRLRIVEEGLNRPLHRCVAELEVTLGLEDLSAPASVGSDAVSHINSRR